MSQSTKIEWVRNTDGTQGHSANPIRFRMKDAGKVVHFCVKHSSGCAHCYSETIGRRWGSPEFIARNLDKVECFLDENVLQAIMRRRKPTTYFLCDMTDWMGEWVPDGCIDRIVETMAECPRHQFQLLTKRGDRLFEYFTQPHVTRRFNDCLPLPNVWLGVSCENQATADERIPHLLATPAAVRFLSCEPLLDEIDLVQAMPVCDECNGEREITDPSHCLHWSNSGDAEGEDWCPVCTDAGTPRIYDLNWCIIGCESGPKRRPMELDWARRLVDQCRAAGVAVFVKQLPINGRVSHEPEEWSADLRVREWPVTAEIAP